MDCCAQSLISYIILEILNQISFSEFLSSDNILKDDKSFWINMVGARHMIFRVYDSLWSSALISTPESPFSTVSLMEFGILFHKVALMWVKDLRPYVVVVLMH